MATLYFPVGSKHHGRLIWGEDEEKLSTEQLENAIWILYYMGYDANENIDCNGNGISFGWRGISEIIKSDYRNILFDFVLLFQMFDIKLKDLEYAKVYLKESYVPLHNKAVVLKSKFIIHNETLYLVQKGNYMVNGSGYNIPNLKKYFNKYKDGNEILPLIAEDKIMDLILKIKIDVAEGTSLNDPYSKSII